MLMLMAFRRKLLVLQSATCAPVCYKIKKHIFPALLLAGKLLLCAVLAVTGGCMSAKEYLTQTYATNVFYFDNTSMDYLYMREKLGNFTESKNYILEITGPVLHLAELLTSETVSFRMIDTPDDLRNLLKMYKPDDIAYTDYFDYVDQHIDRIILCPRLKNAGGFTQGYYKDFWAYSGERVIFINSEYTARSSSALKSATLIIVHESAHKEINRMVEERSISPQYAKKITERYAVIKELELANKMNWYDGSKRWYEKILAELNKTLGLPGKDKTLFPVLQD
jgi:hypothetical protein